MKKLFGILLFFSVFALQAHSSLFTVVDKGFELDGQPFVVKAAELHYPRIPRPYWDHRIKMCKALGMNTVCVYVFWNIHESEESNFNFSEQNDLRTFVKLCQDNEMNVILRPGPYVCAEWEMGGLPWWLLKNKEINLRENDPAFMERVDNYFRAVSDEVKDLTIANGGPIIMIQVENEYGSYGIDKEYVSAIRDLLRKHFGKDNVFFQCDWSSNFTDNGLDDLLWTMNFGTGADIDSQFLHLQELRPDSPLMCSEFWSGWFDKWGANHETRSADEMVAGIDEMLTKGISFSLYMTHGGTNWGHWAGANSPGYAPDVTSYDYDAPINENGEPTSKYYTLRKVMLTHADTDSLPAIPASIMKMSLPQFKMKEVAPLFENLPEARRDTIIHPMEDYDQGFGSILYRTKLPGLSSPTQMTITEPHDYARIFLDGVFIGSLDRRNSEKTIILPSCKDGAQLDILVEAMGRINFGRAIKDYKGITKSVNLNYNNGKVQSLSEWDVFNIHDDLNLYSQMTFTPLDSIYSEQNTRLPAGVYRGTFIIDDKPGDTFIDMSHWGKGLAFVNDHPLGRFWEIGPQQTLYAPGCWLNEGENNILIFDIIGPKEPVVEGLSAPILNNLQIPRLHQNVSPPDINGRKPSFSSHFNNISGWQERHFDNLLSGRYMCIELLDAVNHDNEAAIAELYLLDEEGKRLERENWRVIYADSEETDTVNCSAEKMFDLQESTYWSTTPGKPYPHCVVIDLGEEIPAISAIQYLPRMEPTRPGAINTFRLYLSPTPFTP